MAGKSYKTKQKDLILTCLQNAKGQHVSAEDIVLLLKAQGKEVGTATVYRNLDKLVNEGVVLKYTLPGSLKACYQYGNCTQEKMHCHVICTSCGEVEHLSCDEVDILASHMLSAHRFRLDKHQTIFYGVCEKCAHHNEA